MHIRTGEERHPVNKLHYVRDLREGSGHRGLPHLNISPVPLTPHLHSLRGFLAEVIAHVL